MKRALAIACVAVCCASCRRGGPDPVVALPDGADIVLALRSPNAMADRVRALLTRLPEAEGVADLVRSLAGIDIVEPDRTRESGLDPDRGVAAAAWRGGVLVVLPVRDAALASRRLGLRLARLGFVEQAADVSGVRRFEERRSGRHAALEVGGGLARVCIGPKDACAALPQTPRTPWSPAEVATELGVPDADLVGVVRNPAIARIIPGATGPGRVMLALLGDARLAVRLDGGVRLRLALGPAGIPAMPPGDPPVAVPGVAASLSVALPSVVSAEAVKASLLSACGAPCRGSPDADLALSTWGGAAGAVVLANPTAPPAPFVPSAVLGRLSIVAAARFRSHEGSAAATRLAEASGLSVPAVPPPGVALAAYGRDAPVLVETLAAGGRPEVAGAALAASDPVVARLVLDPPRLAEAAGGIPVDFLRQLVSNLRLVFATAEFRDGRLIVDAGVALR